MKIKHTLFAALCSFLAAGPVLAATPAAGSIHPEADRLLRAVSQQLTAATSFSYKAEVWEDEVIAGDHKVGTTKTVETQVASWPDSPYC